MCYMFAQGLEWQTYEKRSVLGSRLSAIRLLMVLVAFSTVSPCSIYASKRV